MTWRIEALRRAPDESIYRCLARHYETGQARGVFEVSDDSHAWMQRIVRTVQGIDPNFLVFEESSPGTDGEISLSHPWRISMHAEGAPVQVDVFAEHVTVAPVSGYVGDEAAGFALFWGVCRAIAADAQCLIVDPIDFEVIEMDLDVARAREEYGWM